MRFPRGGLARWSRRSRPERWAGGEQQGADWHGWGTLEKNRPALGETHLCITSVHLPQDRRPAPPCARKAPSAQPVPARPQEPQRGWSGRGRSSAPCAHCSVVTSIPAFVSEPTIPDTGSVPPAHWIGARWVKSGCESTGNDQVPITGSFSQPCIQHSRPLGCCRCSSSLLLRCNRNAKYSMLVQQQMFCLL